MFKKFKKFIFAAIVFIIASIPAVYGMESPPVFQVSVIGPSSSGKTELIRRLNGDPKDSPGPTRQPHYTQIELTDPNPGRAYRFGITDNPGGTTDPANLGVSPTKLLLCVVDSSTRTPREDSAYVEKLIAGYPGVPVLFCLSHLDIPGKPIIVLASFDLIGLMYTSTKTGDGINELKQMLCEQAANATVPMASSVVRTAM